MSKDSSIAAQTAAKAAAELFAGTGNTDGAMQAMQRFYNGIVQLGGDPNQIAADAMARAEQNLANGGVQATVQRDLSNEDARWRDALIDNPNDWWNNVGDARASSGGGKGPDFKFKNESANVPALWLNGKHGPAPAWVWEHLGLTFPGSSQGQASAPQQPQPVTNGQNNPVPF